MKDAQFDYVAYLLDVIRECAAYMDVGKVNEFCCAINAAAPTIRGLTPRDICNLDDQLDVAVINRCYRTQQNKLDAVGRANVQAGVLLKALIRAPKKKKARKTMYAACLASWVALSDAQHGMSADYAKSEFHAYVDRGLRDHRVSDYTVTALPRLLALFELQ